MEGYRAFDWNHDASWKQYISNVEVTTQAALESAKRKWYKKNVDANFDVTQSAAASPASAPAPTPAASSASSSSAKAVPPQPPKRDEPDLKVAETVKKSLWTLCAVGTLPITFVCFFTSLFFSFQVFRATYLIVMAMQLISWGINLAGVIKRPKLEVEYWVGLLSLEPVHYVYYILLFVFEGPSIISITPLAIYSFFNSAKILKVSLPPLAPWVDQMVRQQASALLAATAIEIWIFPYLVLGWLTGAGFSLVSIALYYQFLKFRFRASRSMQQAVKLYLTVLDTWMSKVPYYTQVRDWTQT